MRIGAMEYKVEYTENVIVIDGKQMVGKADYLKHTITIDREIQDMQCREQTLLHEVLHCISREYCLGIDDEKTIDLLANALYQVNKDNPELFRGGII